MTDELTAIDFRAPNENIRRVTRADPDSRGGGGEHFERQPAEEENGEKSPGDDPAAARPPPPVHAHGELAKPGGDEVCLSSSARAILDQQVESPPSAPDSPAEDAAAPEEHVHVDFLA
jgi:hypothetical protein